MKKRFLPVVLLVFLLLTTLMVACDDTPVVNVTLVAKSGGDFDTIKAAVDVAKEGDTIVIEAGMYDESFDIDKPLTLKAASKGVIVEGLVQIRAQNVTIEGLKFIPKNVPTLPDNPSFANKVSIVIYDMADVSFENIQINGGNTANVNLKRGIMGMTGASFAVRNSIFENLYTAIFVNQDKVGTEGVTMTASYNLFTNNVIGIGGTEDSKVTILNNIFESLGPTKKQAEGIGLGTGIKVYDANNVLIDETTNSDSSKKDVAALENSNAFLYSEDFKVHDYR